MKLRMNEIEKTLLNNETIDLSKAEKLNVARIDVVNASGQVPMMDVVKALGANLVQPLAEHQEKHRVTTLIHNAFRLYFALDEPVELKKVKEIERELVITVKSEFPDIDINDRDDKDIKPTSSNVIKAEDTEYKPVLNSEYYELSTKHYKNSEEIMRDFQELQEASVEETKENIANDEELIERAEHIAAKGNHKRDSQSWKSMVIGIWNSQQLGNYSEDTALKIIRALDVNSKNVYDKEYKKYKINLDSSYTGKISTIATLIWYSNNEGYVRDYKDRFYVEEDSSLEGIYYSEIMIKQYIYYMDVYKIITNGLKNTIIDSPTGSGKTTATHKAVIKWLKEDRENRYVCFALPTKALTSQEVADGKSGKALMERQIAKIVMKFNYDKMGVNFLFGTYDKAKMYVDEAVRQNENAEILVIADEAHKEVTDSDYRMKAIEYLFNLREHDNVVKFIGLSGTPEEIDKNYYDELVKFRQIDAKPIFNNFKVVTYSASKEYESTTVSIIKKEIEEGRRVLQFVNNIKAIKRMRKVLEESGIKVVSIYSDIKDKDQKEAYNYLMEEQKFPKGYDVVLATNVISDGINILNEDENYSVIVSPHRDLSPIFNLGTIKQMSNRFRNQYTNIIIPLFITEFASDERLNHTKLYGMENRYKMLVEHSTRLAGFLKERFKGQIDRYHPSYYETSIGLPYVNRYYNSTMDTNSEEFKRALRRYRHMSVNPKMELLPEDMKLIENMWHVEESVFTPNLRKLRKKASKDAEEYYAYFPYAFVSGLEKILEYDSADVVPFTEYITEEDESIAAKFKELNELRTLKMHEKRDRVGEFFTEEMADEIKTLYFRHGRHLEDSELLSYLKEAMNNTDYIAMLSYVPYAEYDEVISIIKNLPINRGQNKLKAMLKSYHTLEAFEKSSTETATNMIFTKLMEVLTDEDRMEGVYKGTKYITNASLKKLPDEIHEETKWSKKEINKVYRDFFTFTPCEGSVGRGKGGFEPVSLVSIAVEFGLSVESINNIYQNYLEELYRM